MGKYKDVVSDDPKNVAVGSGPPELEAKRVPTPS